MDIDPANDTGANPLENLNCIFFVSFERTYNLKLMYHFLKDNSEEFKQGLYSVMRVLNVPARPDDNTSNLQAVAKLISEKLNQTALNAILNAKPSDNVICLIYLVLLKNSSFEYFELNSKAKHNTTRVEHNKLGI